MPTLKVTRPGLLRIIATYCDLLRTIASGSKTSSHRLNGWWLGAPRLSYKERLNGAQKKNGGCVLSPLTKRKKLCEESVEIHFMDFVRRHEWS